VLTDTKKEANETAESLTGEIDHLTTIKKTLISRIDVLTVEKETCDKALELSKDELDKLEAQKSTVTTNISVLNDEKVKLFDKIDELSKELQNKETQFEDAMSSYRDESQKLEDELKVLEQKKIKMVSDMEENARTDEQSRNALALRQRLLDDREENLRIRETKVSQQEESISRNNTLLNL
jgi:chromosome segregation ATPase